MVERDRVLAEVGQGVAPDGIGALGEEEGRDGFLRRLLGQEAGQRVSVVLRREDGVV